MRGSVQQVRDETGAPDPHVFEIGGFASAVVPITEPSAHVAQPSSQLIAPAPVTPVAPESTPEGKPLTTRQLLAQLRARLRVVEREIKARQSLETERGQIKRLIAAAKTERNNVRAIRAAG